MCRGLTDPQARRCVAHSNAVRRADYAETRLDETFEGWLSTFEARTVELTLAGPKPTEAGTTLSIWAQAWKELLAKVAAATAKLEAKRASAKAVRAQRDAENLSQIMDDHLREVAETAIAQHEASIEALHLAQEKQRELEIMRQIDLAAEEFGTRRELVQRALDEVDTALSQAHAETERLRVAVSGRDELPRMSGPLKGMPGATVRAFRDAQKQEAFYLDLHKATVARLASTPSKAVTERMLALTTEQIETGKAYVHTTRLARDAALAARRRTKPTEEVAELPAAA